MSNINIIRWNSLIDIEAIDQFICHIQIFEYSIISPEKFNFCIHDLVNYYKGPNDKINFFVALNAQEIIGTLGIQDLQNNNAELRKFYIHKDFRGMNIGSRFLDIMKTAARESNFSNIYTATMPEKVRAQQFYLKHNFIQINHSELPKNFIVQKLDKLFYKYSL